MVLWITDRDIDCGITDCKMDFIDFASKASHPFIATTKWDKVYIDVTDETPRGIIRQLVPITVVSPIYDIEGKFTFKQVEVLCEIYPDEASKIMTYYRKGELDKLRELLSRLKEVECTA